MTTPVMTPVDEAKSAVLSATRKTASSYFAQHHALYPTLLVKGEIAEHLIAHAIRTEGIELDYESGSHKIGADFFITNPGHYDKVGVSMKSGRTVNNKHGKQTLSLSGSRTTKHKTLQEKINFLEETSPDLYMCVTTPHTSAQAGKLDQLEYNILTFEGATINYHEVSDWTQKGEDYHLVTPEYSIVIRNSMSSQVWVTFNDVTHLERTSLTVPLRAEPLSTEE